MKGDKRNDRLRKKNTPRYILPVPFDLRGVLLILDFPRSHKAPIPSLSPCPFAFLFLFHPGEQM